MHPKWNVEFQRQISDLWCKRVILPVLWRSPELVQIDGSEHAWFEDSGETCTLLAFVDDATSGLMQLRFVASESAFDYFRATRA
jgi:hypothetical protein